MLLIFSLLVQAVIVETQQEQIEPTGVWRKFTTALNARPLQLFG